MKLSCDNGPLISFLEVAQRFCEGIDGGRFASLPAEMVRIELDHAAAAVRMFPSDQLLQWFAGVWAGNQTQIEGTTDEVKAN